MPAITSRLHAISACLCAMLMVSSAATASTVWVPADAETKTVLAGSWVEIPSAGLSGEEALTEACERSLFRNLMGHQDAENERIQKAHTVLKGATVDMRFFEEAEHTYVSYRSFGSVALAQYAEVDMRKMGNRFALQFQPTRSDYDADAGRWKRTKAYVPSKTMAQGVVSPLPSGAVSVRMAFPLKSDGTASPGITKNYLRCGDLRTELQPDADE